MGGWLQQWKDWVVQQLEQWWNDVEEFAHERSLDVFDALLSCVDFVVNQIPVPAFIEGHSIGNYLGSAGPTIGWIATELRVAEGLGFIGAAYAFRLLRKIVTVGFW